jgi:fatty-acyl-CoA synthase
LSACSDNVDQATQRQRIVTLDSYSRGVISMANGSARIRQKLSHVTEAVTAVKRLRDAGIFDFGDLRGTLATAKNARAYGPQAALAIQGGRKYASLPAVVDEHGTLTYKQVDDDSTALARGLNALGIGAGSVVGLLCRDHRGLLIAMAAGGKLGAQLVLMNTGFAKPQFTQVCERENVKAVLHDSEFLGLLDALPPEVLRVVTWIDDGTELPVGVHTIEDLIAANAGEPLPAPGQAGRIVVLTSGTTGLPKGAERNKIPPLSTAEWVDRIPFPRRGAMVIVSPIFHGTGLGTYLIGANLGNKVVTTRRFKAERTLQLIAEHKADMLVAVPTMLHRMVELAPEIIARYDTSSLKVIATAGSALSPELSNRVQDTFGDVLYNIYASTECGFATVATPADLRRAPGTAGRSPVGCEVVLFDEYGQRVDGVNNRGRIFVRSSLRFEGYTDGRTKEVIDGYMSSGDMGHFDENGLLFVDGRDDDMIVSGGENVYPIEVEELLGQHPHVSDVAVVGVPDERFGQALVAFVVARDGADLAADDVRAYVRDHLARHKVPRHVEFIVEVPRNATGKILRRSLIDDATAD